MRPGTVPPDALERLHQLAARRAAATPFAAPDASPPPAAGDDAVAERDGSPRGQHFNLCSWTVVAWRGEVGGLWAQ